MCAAAAPPLSAPARDVSVPDISVRTGIITARLESDRSVYHVGEPIKLRLTLINGAAQKIFIGPLAPYELSNLQVFNAEGQALSPSVGGGPCICQGRPYTVALNPGEPLIVSYDRYGNGAYRDWADLKDWGYVLRQPGSYALIASLQLVAFGIKMPEFRTSPTDKSNTVHITIIK